MAHHALRLGYHGLNWTLRPDGVLTDRTVRLETLRNLEQTTKGAAKKYLINLKN